MAQLTAVPNDPFQTADHHLVAKKRQPWTYWVGKGLFWLLVAFIIFYTLFPFYWAVVTSLKAPSRLFDTPVAYWPKQVTWDNYKAVYHNHNFMLALKNSAIVATASVVLALVIGAMAAYALGRLKFRGRNWILYLILSMTMFPAIAILGSLYQMIRTANAFNTLQALVFAYMTFSLPFTVWVLTNFFRAMPGELEEASLVDGSTPFQSFYKILLPLAAPGMVTTGLLAFIAAWNEFLFAQTYTITPNRQTVPVAIANFGGASEHDLPWGSIMAASVVVTVPLIILVLIFQRKIISGLTAGAVKG
jgi:trehalose/maltose transport system permease protein